jgi:hypothetical protein
LPFKQNAVKLFCKEFFRKGSSWKFADQAGMMMGFILLFAGSSSFVENFFLFGAVRFDRYRQIQIRAPAI